MQHVELLWGTQHMVLRIHLTIKTGNEYSRSYNEDKYNTNRTHGTPKSRHLITNTANTTNIQYHATNTT